jgi:TonB family protein
VDHEVVALSEGREAYLEALLAMGSAPPQPDLAPAAPFLRRRQLSSRIQSLLKEVTMSKGKLVSCYVLTVAAALATAWFAAVSFPLEASPLVQARQSTASEGVIRVELAPNLSEPLRSNLRARLAAFQGQPYTPESREEILKAAQEVDSTARIMVMSRSETAEGWLVTTFIIAPVAARVTAPTDFPPSSGKRIAVDGIVQQSKLINQPKPQYPPLARQARIQGTVRFSAVIDKDGRVTNLTLVSGHPLLAPAAQDAVRQWVYQPTLLNGQPVEVMTEIDVNFTLAGDTPPPAQ